MRHSTLSNPGKLYVSAVILAGSFAIAASITEMLVEGVRYEWFILAALTIVSGSATVKLPSIPASLSVSETFVFTSVLLFGAPAGTLTVALDGLIISLWLNRQRKELHRVLFNVAAPAVSIWLAAQLFFLLAGIAPLAQHRLSAESGALEPFAQAPGITEFLIPLLAFTIAYFLLNSWLIALAVSFETSVRALVIWRTNFVWLSLNFLCGASVAALLTVYPRQINLAYLGAILPLLFVLYLTYKTSMARVEDANKHLEEINGMYISTIEALAMAVDAKDQVTHGHIRRVQAYAVGLAKALGIRDRGLLGAIEAASLLHDMGKLAIPEHILNKPGRLTDAEFSKMKLHASIGADILSSIHFPYPVVPIVRHHHENWDGTGYPDGLAGTAIPIGARILSVVDCFDALTSDRPYRPRLSDEQALAILLDRRGRMYDQLVVDTFIEVFRTIEIPDSAEATDAHYAIAQLSRALPEPLAHSEGTRLTGSATANDAADLGLALRVFASTAGLASHERLSVLAQQIRRIATADTVIVQSTDATNTLRVVHTDGLYHDTLQDRTSMVGHGVTGWVAANGQFALNSPARVEFEAGTAEALQACTAVPLLLNRLVCGVLSVYSIEPNHFTYRNLNFLSAIGALVASTLESQISFTETKDQGLTESGISELLQAQLAADPAYSCQLLLVSGDHGKIDRIQSVLLERDPDAIIARLSADALACVSAVTNGALREGVPFGSGCKLASARFPEDGSVARELLASLRQSRQDALAQSTLTDVSRAQLH